MSKHPREMYLLTLTEMFQRCAFWGVANLLVLYLVQVLKFPEAKADILFGVLTGVAFALPVIGGWVADHTSYKFVVVAGMISTALGAFFMAVGTLPFVYMALVFLAFGTGLGTPGVYSILGQIYEGKHTLREGGFSIFYSIVNLGIFFAMVLLGFLSQIEGWSLAFFIAGCLAVCGLLSFVQVMRSPLFTHLGRHHMKKEEAHQLKKHEKKRILVIIIISIFAILLWMGMNQGGSSLTLFALKFTDRKVGNFMIPPSWLLSTESLFLFLLVYPITNFYLYLAKKKKDPSPPIKCAFSLIALALAFTVMTVAASVLPKGGTVSPFYLVSTFFLMSFAEMFLTPIGLSLVTALSPPRFRARLVGFWFLCIGIGLFLGGKMAGLMESFVHLSSFFKVFVSLFFGGAILLFLLSKKLNQMRNAAD